MRFICASPALYLRFTCTLRALHLRFTCALPALHLHFTCALLALNLRFTCAFLFYRDDIIFQSGNIEINRGDIDDILTNQYLADNHAYRGYKQDFQIFIQHINPDYVRESRLIVQPICFKGHWVLIVGRLKDKVWKLYDSLPNLEHKAICTEVVSLKLDFMKLQSRSLSKRHNNLKITNCLLSSNSVKRL
ncbi:hypothetical protein IEQ34_005212 [Dendrobium chrysotoxum]|uniref:Ubiquitin-like protease family profile domain-containing protein n=1 Tax=Dendrobium chrysotoxum TaxID=161865 RepID=A0AAV7HBN3_DENCH|nr:hypothetical protein IEQ34_005212 [Dendrobium chrysotoxum]